VLNQYLSIKQLAPYREGAVKVRNSVYKSKIEGIRKSVKESKKGKKVRSKKRGQEEEGQAL
jgi:hypothetical protein